MAGLSLCVEAECYICKRIDRKQLTERQARFKYWKNRIEKGKVIERTDLKLPIYINNQIEANGICRKTDINQAWAKKLFGFCRPSWGIPLLMSIEEFQMLKPRKNQGEIKDQFRAFRLEYDRLARKFTKK